VAAAGAKAPRTAKEAAAVLAAARLANKMSKQLRRAERARARATVKVYPTQAVRRLSRHSLPDKFTQELCAWIDTPLPKMSATCEYEDNSVQRAAREQRRAGHRRAHFCPGFADGTSG